MKLLCLSFWTPPQLRPQSILIGKMIPEWLRQGMQPVVLTYDGCGHWETAAPVVTIPAFERGRLAKFSRTLGRLMERRYFDRLVDIAARTIQAHGIRLVFSFANPMESNILGALLKQRLGVVFISHFSDPYADSPLKESSPRQRQLMLERERLVVERSDRIVFVNDRLRHLVMKKYPEPLHSRGVVIPHCYDPALYGVWPRSNDRFIMSHVGVFYPNRQPEKLLLALALLKQRRPELEHAFRLRLIGGVNPYAGFSQERLETLIRSFGLENMVETLPTVDYGASLAHMAGSDALLALDADLPDSPFLPSKLIDYLGADRPILALTPHNSPTWEVVTRLGGAAFPHHETEKIATHLENLVLNGVHNAHDGIYAQQFSVANTTARYLQLFERTLTECQAP
ncbi:MAG: glycosyltransferase [Magnetococcales bacterium]|nr:glycosyltransferase [Magnetococcales bacterium]